MTSMRRRLFVLLAALMTAWLAMPGRAQPASATGNIAATLVSESPIVAPGSTVTLALVMRPKAGWHGYWKNPGDSGIETQIAWQLPRGLAAGPIQYPVPDRLLVAGLMNYVYKGDYAQLIDIAVPANVAPGTRLPLRAKVDFLACTEEVCVPETAEVAVDLQAGPPSAVRPDRARFDQFRAAMPRPLGSLGRFALAGGRFRLAIPLPTGIALDDPYFFPLTDGALDYSDAQSITRSGDTLIVETKAAPDGAGALAAVEGVIKLNEDLGLSLAAAPGAVAPAGQALADAAAGVDAATVLAALLGAILGGLLLNIMPCVFPILSLKALSLARAGGDERSARREALAYTTGAVAICLALGAALLALRAGGAAAGWAFQLQDPRVITLLLLLVTAIALNLAGLFELPAVTGGDGLAARGGTSGAFWTGALAAFVATPCTGPFMGAALGAALVLPPALALAVFAGLGFGLALPFLLIGFVPALRRRLPRPGPWMGKLRRVLSVPMFLTALALAWILGRQVGVDGMALGLGAALVLALGLWWVGRRQGGSRPWLPLVPAAAAALAAILLVPTAAPATATAAAGAPGVLDAEPFSEARLAALQQEGRPVFVYFTADWCITCKVNEKGALQREPVVRAFADRNVAVLVGDWTRGDPAIGRFLAGHGRSGVPLYLFYRPSGPVEILPQVLTPGRLVSLVERKG